MGGDHWSRFELLTLKTKIKDVLTANAVAMVTFRVTKMTID